MITIYMDETGIMDGKYLGYGALFLSEPDCPNQIVTGSLARPLLPMAQLTH